VRFLRHFLRFQDIAKNSVGGGISRSARTARETISLAARRGARRLCGAVAFSARRIFSRGKSRADARLIVTPRESE